VGKILPILKSNKRIQDIEAGIGAFLRERRKRAGISQEVLAERCHIVRRTLYNLESGAGGNVTTLLSILQELGALEECASPFLDPIDSKAKSTTKIPTKTTKSRSLKATSEDANPWVMTKRPTL